MSDHFSGPAVMGDPAVDITDFYAFPSPERPGNLVLIMNVFPMATSHVFLQRCCHASISAATADAIRRQHHIRSGGTHDRCAFQ